MIRDLRRIVIVGGSVAAVTAADTLRLEGFDGDLVMVSDEFVRPYSRVPLSKAVLAGTVEPETALLGGGLPDGIDFRTGTRAIGLDTTRKLVRLKGAGELSYDGLVIASGASARRLAGPQQRGERVLRTLNDATELAERADRVSEAVVVGAGFLGMEVASTLSSRGVAVTVIARDLPLRRLLGEWLAGRVVKQAEEAGVHFVRAPNGVRLVGNPIAGVDCGELGRFESELIVTAVGDVPETGWLRGSGIRTEGGAVVMDRCCRVTPEIVAAGDVVAMSGANGSRRSPFWTSAMMQARRAAQALLEPADDRPLEADPYYFTEQFGLDIKVAGQIPVSKKPNVLMETTTGASLVQWLTDNGHPTAAATVNHRIPLVKLKRLARTVM